MLFPALFVFRWILFYRDFEWVRGLTHMRSMYVGVAETGLGRRV